LSRALLAAKYFKAVYKHGLDFADLDEIFFDNALVFRSHNAGGRWIVVGVNIRGVLVVVFARRPF
jgi:hypothetical protein